MAEATKTNHYIDNSKFLEALLEHKDKVNKAREAGVEPPPVTIGDCFIKIAKHLSYKNNFINYSYKDEMISDGIENCLAVVNNFDPTKSKNPFAYFTQITFFAFVRRIIKEKKQTDTKYRFISQMDITDMITQDHDNGEFHNQFLDYLKTQLDGKEFEKVAAQAASVTEKMLHVEQSEEN